MNIFLLDALTTIAAAYHCDKHCIKMILETTQLLYTAWWFGRDTLPLPELDACPHDPYRPTHQNHPSAIWVRASPTHYNWLLELGFALCKEYYNRYNSKFHKCLTHLERLQAMGPPAHIGEETYQPPQHKCATTGLPPGIQYFHCAINDSLWQQCAVYTNGQLNAIETYRRYYATKPWALKWGKKSEAAPMWYKQISTRAAVPMVSLSPHSPKSIATDNAGGVSQALIAI